MIEILTNKLSSYCAFLKKPELSLLAYESDYYEENQALQYFQEKNDFDVSLLFVEKSNSKQLLQELFNEHKALVEDYSEIVVIALYEMEDEDLIVFCANESSDVLYEIDNNLENLKINMHLPITHFFFDKETIEDKESYFFEIRLNSDQAVADKLSSLLI